MGDDPNQFGNSRRWIIREVEDSLRRLQDRLDRPLPDPPPRARHRHRGDARRARRPRAPGQGPLPRLLDLPGLADRRGAVGGARPRPRALRLRAAALHPARRAAIEADVLPTCLRHGMGVIPWSPLGRRLAERQVAQGRRRAAARRARERLPARYDLSDPANQRKLDAADALGKLADEAGMTLIQLALAFVINHPAVTAAIIGPRTMEQLESQLGADGGRARRRRCSTASTRSSRPGRTSTRSTPAGRTRRCSPRRAAASGSRARSSAARAGRCPS